jgi:hypothetical protein
MLYISYGSVCELKTQVLLAGDLDLIGEDPLIFKSGDLDENIGHT